MIEITFTVEDIDYSDRLDSQLPLVFETLSKNGDLNPALKLACKTPEATTKIVKGVLKAMNKNQKEKLAVTIVNSQKERLMRKLNNLAADYGIVGKVTSCTVTKR